MSETLGAAVLAGVLTAVKSISEEILRASGNAAKREFEKLLVDFEIGFKKYVQRNYEKCSRVKTLLHRYEPINLESAYVAARIKFKNEEISESTLIDRFNKYKRIVVTGMAGCGKSLMMKNVFVTLCKSSYDKIPVFIELRHLNNLSDPKLVDYIFEQLNSLISNLKPTQFEYALRQGKFVIILDGIDEIAHQNRDKYCQQILEVSDKFPDLIIICSSRADDRFAAWNEFYVGNLMPLNKEQVNQLIEKIDYEDNVKRNFLKAVNSSLFASHEQFLSNPLLCTMMLMTFDQFAEIPSKMHIFYSQAFDVLFNKHDATKASFRRKFYTTLSIDDFKRLFATFCMFTYLDRKISPLENEAKQYIAKSIEYEGINLDPMDFLKDLQESICIILKDGDNCAFLHRSFQEYFVALFLAERQGEEIEALIQQVIDPLQRDNVTGLLIEINRDSFETKFFAKKVSQLKGVVEKIDIRKTPKKFFDQIYLGLSLHRDRESDKFSMGYTIGRGNKSAPWFPIYDTLQRFYESPKSLAARVASRQTNFDWVEFLKKNKIKIDPEEKHITVEKVTDAMLLGTPTCEYLEKTKVLIIEIDKEIQERLKSRSKLLSNLLLKKKRKTRRD